MRKNIVILLFFSLSIHKLNAGINSRFHGRLENRFYYYLLDNDSKVNPDNLFRIQNVSNVSRLFLYADYYKNNLINFRSRILYKIISERHAQTRYEFILHELNWDYSISDQILVRLGKQRMNWGTGYAWNPTNTVQPPKDPFQPAEEKEGVNALKIHTLFEKFYITTLGIYNSEKKNINIAAKVGTSLDNYEISGYIHKMFNRKYNYGFDFVGFYNDFELHGEFALRQGSERMYTDEAGRIFTNDNDYFLKFIIGGSYTLNSGLMIISEYYYDQTGYTRKQIENYVSTLPYSPIVYQSVGFGRHVLFLTVLKPRILERFSIQGSVLSNLHNGSIMFIPDFILSPNEKLSFTIRLMLSTSGFVSIEKKLNPVPHMLRLEGQLYF